MRNGTGGRQWRRAWLGGLLAGLAAALPAQAGDPPDFTDLSLEDLARVDLVYAASRHEQSRGEAPSSVTIVSAEEIRRHGYQTVADVLRTVGGFYVTDDRNYSYLGVRGFGRPGDYNTRILLLVDGVRINEPVYDGAYFAREFLLDVAVIDRIEIVRGPGASMYGTSAFFAVVNVVTRQGRQLRGGEVGISVGSFGQAAGQATFGTVTRGGVDLLVSAAGFRLDGRRLVFPEMAQDDWDGVADGLDGEEARNLFARASWRGLSATAAHVRREKGIPTGSYETVFGDPRSRTADWETLASAGYDGTLGARARGTFRAHVGRSGYDGAYAYGPGHEGLYVDGARGSWWGLDANVSTTGTGRHTFTVGAEIVDNRRQEQWAAQGGVPDKDLPGRSRRWGAYAQDEVKLGPVLAGLGVRHDRYESFGGRTSPRLGLIVNPAGPTTVKALYGTAFRAPNVYELHYYDYAVPDLRPETIRSAEVIVEHALGSNVHLSASAFTNDIDDLISLYTPSEGELAFRNAERFRSQGLEVVFDARRRGVAVRGAYTFQVTRERDTRVEVTNSPRHLAALSVSAPFRSRYTAAADAVYLSPRHTLDGAHTPAVFRVDTHLAARALRSRLEAALTVRNVFDARYADPGSEEHRQDMLLQDGRTFGLSLKWRF